MAFKHLAILIGLVILGAVLFTWLVQPQLAVAQGVTPPPPRPTLTPPAPTRSAPEKDPEDTPTPIPTWTLTATPAVLPIAGGPMPESIGINSALWLGTVILMLAAAGAVATRSTRSRP